MTDALARGYLGTPSAPPGLESALDSAPVTFATANTYNGGDGTRLEVAQ